MKNVHLKRFLALALAVMFVLQGMSLGTLAAFDDVPEDAWYTEAVEFVSGKKLMVGDADGAFNPGNVFTRAEAVTVLFNLSDAEKPAYEATFADVAESDWYAPYAIWACKTGITYGDGEGNFMPGRAIVREDLLSMMYRCVTAAGLETAGEADLSVFTDADSISAYACDALVWAVSAGLVKGYPDGTIGPRNSITRAEVAQILMGLVKNVLPETGDPEGPLTKYGLSKEIEGGSILHVWCWDFNTIREMIPQIAAAGFSSIQTSPICPVKDGDNGGMSIMSDADGKWWWHYQPTDYTTIGNFQLGTDAEFRAMTEVAHSYGVKVIVDQVMNHTTSDYDAVSDGIKNAYWGEGDDLGNYAYSADSAWRHQDIGWNERNRTNGTVGWMSTLIDWNTQNPYVQQYMLNFAKLCVEAGADGFRYDAARHIELPTDAEAIRSNFWPIVLQNGSVFQYGECLGTGILDQYQALTFTTPDGTEKHFNTTISNYGSTLRSAVSGKNVSTSRINSMGNYANLGVTWVESHDNYCNESSYNTLNEQQVIQAWAILSARKAGTPLFFSRPNNSSAAKPWGDNVVGPHGSLFFLDPQVTAVNFFRIDMDGLDEYLSNPNGSSQVVMIERGDAGAVIVNLQNTDLVMDGVPVQHMADGTYTDQVYGTTFTVVDGAIYGTVRAGRVAVVYNPTVTGRLSVPAGISLSTPDGTAFLDETLTVSASLRGIDHATYQIDDGAEVAYTNGANIVLGEGVEFDTYIKLTINGYDASNKLLATASATYLKKSFVGTHVYMSSADAAVRGWSNVYVYIWGPGEDAGKWPGTKMELQDNGFYHYQLKTYAHENGHHVIFNNGSSGGTNQFDAGELAAGESKVWTSARKWVDYDPSMSESSALVYMTPGTSSYTTETLSVTLGATGCATATYQLGSAEPVTYTDGTVIEIAGVAAGESITLTLVGYLANGTQATTASATYTRIDASNPAIVYIEDGYMGWTAYAVHFWNNVGDTTSWPGVVAEKQTEGSWNGYWKVTVPAMFAGQTGINVIINNNGQGSQSSDYTIDWGQTRVMTADGQWTLA